MKPLQTQPTAETRYFTLEGAKSYLSLGRSSVENIAKEAGARIKIGSRVLYDRVKLDSYIEALANNKEVQKDETI